MGSTATPIRSAWPTGMVAVIVFVTPSITDYGVVSGCRCHIDRCQSSGSTATAGRAGSRPGTVAVTVLVVPSITDTVLPW